MDWLNKTLSSTRSRAVCKTVSKKEKGSSFWSRKNKEYRLLMLGFDSAGKTTILYQMKHGQVVSYVPTIGFNVETITIGDKKNKKKVTIWDVGGQDKTRILWKHYYENTVALIFVVDSSDKDRVDEAKEILQKLLEEEELKASILLVFAQ